MKNEDLTCFWHADFRVIVASFFILYSSFFTAHATNANADWDNGAANNDFAHANNWAGNTLPSTGYSGVGDFIRIDRDGTNRAVYRATLDNPGTGATSAQAGIFSRLQIADVSGNGGLDITNGTFKTDSTSSTVIGSSGRTGTLVVNGAATVVDLGGWVFVGNSTAGTGVVNLINGSLSSSRDNPVGGVSHVSIALGNGNNASGSIIMSGGTLNTRSGILLGGPGTTGTGRFEMRGGTANIGPIGSTDDGFWVQSSNSVLAAYVSNNTLGQIYIANLANTGGTYANGNVIFMPGAKLEPGFLGATNPGAWDLMKFDGALLTNGLALASGTDTNWSFQFATNGSQTVLRVIYISANLSAPSGIVAYPANSQVSLRWSAEAGATNYLVKRATTSGGSYSVTNVAASPNFTDTGLTNGVTYFYVVSAALTNGVTGNSFEVRATPFSGNFVHPGVVHTIADLERMRTNILATNNPWFMGFTNLLADPHSSSAYPMAGPLTTIYRDAVNPTLPTAFQDDCGAAYQNALLWYLTGDPAHAAKAIQLLDAWSTTCTNASGSDTRLACGLQGYKFITAAEIIRYTGAPWSSAEITTCSNFIRTVLLPQNRMYGGGNWGQIGACSAMAAGVFMDDEAVFNEALNCIKFGAPSECDLGIVNYINPGGWTTEADRDLGHWGLALDNLTECAWIAWCQGLDLWTFQNNRLLTAHEYLGQYILTTNVPSYTAGSQCDGMANGGLTTTGLGTTYNPFWEQAFHPYQNLIGLPAPWTSNMVNVVRPEDYDRDHIAFGTLVAALPPRAAGLPLMPSGLTATWSNAQVKLVWNSASNAASYFVKRAVARGGPYTNIANSITATNFADNTVANGVLYFYKISATNAVGETANSGLATAYPSATGPASPAVLTAKTTSHVRIDLSWTAVPGAMNYSVKRATGSGGPYAAIANGQGTLFQTYADTSLSPNTTYFYVISASNNIAGSAVSTEASATTLPAPPPVWAYADAGYPTTPGNTTCSNGVFTVRGAGLDISGFANADSFGLCYVNLTGDGAIIARITGRTNYSGLHKAGLTMRESLANGARHFTTLFNGQNTNSICYRTSNNGNASTAGTTNIGGVFPQWQKLIRAGNVFSGYSSPDGTNWTILGSITNTMNNTLLAGLAVTSRNNGAPDTVVFDNVSVTGLWPALPGTPAGLSAVALDGSAFLSWGDATNATGYNLKRGNSSAGPFVLVGTNLGNLYFTNTGLANGAMYYYVVSGTNFFGESTNSNPVDVRPVSPAPPHLNLQALANQLQFNWPTDHIGWKLQVQTNPLAAGLNTNWQTVFGSSATNQMNLPVTITNGSVFYRLLYP
jgi:hypothetical protein